VMERQRAHLEPLSAAEHSLAWLVRNDGDEAALKAQIEALLSAQAAA